MSLPKEFKQVFLALLAGFVVVVFGLVPGVASASVATVAPEGSGHIVITYACGGKIGLYIQGFNDVEGSDPISFVLTDNITDGVVANVTDVSYGTYGTSGIGLDFGAVYDITATGPGGYSERFQGTFNCAAETVTATPPVFTDKSGSDDTYTVPSMVGVEYSVGGVVTAAGTYPVYPGTGTVTVTAGANPGYVLEGTSTWTHEFTPTGIWLGSFVVTQPNCETIKLSFDYFGGPGEWEVLRQNLPYVSGSEYVQIASGSVSNVTGNVSDVVVTGQPAGIYDLAILPLDGKKIDEHATVTVDACAAPPSLRSATPNAPTFSDKAGTVDDTYSVVDTSGVTYLVGNVVTTGTHPGTGIVTVTAEAQSGYVLQGTRTWAFEFTNAVGSTSITPAAPTFTDKAGTAHDTYTVPSMVGVEYLVDGVLTATGTYPGTGTVTITARPTAGYVLNGTTTWTFQFTDVVAPLAVAPTTTTVASVVPPAVAGQPALNPGFGAKTGWGEDTRTPTGNSPFAPVLLTMAGLAGLAFYLRRKTGEQ